MSAAVGLLAAWLHPAGAVIIHRRDWTLSTTSFEVQGRLEVRDNAQ
eukprot:gene2134-485_t